MIRNLYKNFKLIKYRLLIGYFVMFIGISFLSKNYVDTMPKEISVSIFDMLCDVYKQLGMIGSHTYSLIIIPIFSLMLISIIDCDKKNVCIIRYNSRNNIWNKQLFCVIIISLIFSITIVFLGYLVSGLCINGFNNTWTSTEGIIYKLLNNPSDWDRISSNFSTYKVLLFTFTSTFLGLVSFGMLICVLKLFLKNQYVLLIVIVQMYVPILFRKFSIIFNQMIVNLPNLVYPKSIFANDVYLVFLIVALYKLGQYAIEKKDFNI